MPTILLIVHEMVAVGLIGALTHQALSVWWPTVRRDTALASFRAVRAGSYTNAIILLYVTSALLGCVIYPTYRIAVRTILEALNQRSALGLFETKEQFVAIGLGLLPAYWYYWRPTANAQEKRTRDILTALLTVIVWCSFLIGHILNNIKGFGL